jgi:lipopolysaccharide export system ATP-binding protein
VLDFLGLFRRTSRRRQDQGSGFWRIDLKSLGGPITATATELLNLPSARRPKRRAETSKQRAAAEPRQQAAQRAPARRNAHAHGHGRALGDEHAQFDAPAQLNAHQPPRRAVTQRHVQQQAIQSDRLQDSFLAARGVEKSFGGRKVVDGVHIYVRRGEAVGLLGPNGAGKTTVFYMITGLIKADRGRIELDGHDVTVLPMYQRSRLGIGYLPQEASIFRGLNVEDNIRAVLEVVEPNRRRREADLNALLEEFDIARLRKTPSIALSGGERRRVEIARALASRPNYMLLDEPFAGIDPIAVGDIQALVRHLTNRGIGVLITDHNVRETLGLTDRAYIIYSGQVLMEGRPDDIVNDPEVRRLYLGDEFRL